jgi:hypothetical protein
MIPMFQITRDFPSNSQQRFWITCKEHVCLLGIRLRFCIAARVIWTLDTCTSLYPIKPRQAKDWRNLIGLTDVIYGGCRLTSDTIFVCVTWEVLINTERWPVNVLPLVKVRFGDVAL